MPQTSALKITNLGVAKAGSYAVSTIDAASWLDMPAAAPKQKKRKSKAVKQVLHPLFIQCAELTNDPFWVNLFITAGYGKFPKKFTYKDGTLVYKKSSKMFSLDVPQVSHEAIYACMDFFRTHGGIVSDIDLENIRREQYAEAELEAEMAEDISWSKLSKKVKDVLIDLHVETLTNRLQLNREETKNLRYRLNIGIILGYFNTSNIILDGKCISQINGLLFDITDRTFSIDPNIKPKVSRSYSKTKKGAGELIFEKDTIPNYKKSWVKYLEDMDKKIAKSIRNANKVRINIQSSTHTPHRRLILTPVDATPSETCETATEDVSSAVTDDTDYYG